MNHPILFRMPHMSCGHKQNRKKPGKVSFLRFKHLVIPPNAASKYTTYTRQHIRVTFAFYVFLFLLDKFLGAGAASGGSVSVVEYAGVAAGAALAMLTAPAGVD